MTAIRFDDQAVVSEKHFDRAKRTCSFQSWCGLCATSFFLAETSGVTMPFVNTYLVECGWSYDLIGAVVSAAALVSWSLQFPVGLLIESVPRFHKSLLGIASLVVGVCIGLLPASSTSRVTVGILLITASLAKSLFGPLTNSLTLQLVDHEYRGQAVGIRESWNHAGNIAAALTAMILVEHFSVSTVFSCITAVSILAFGSLIIIKHADLKDRQAAAQSNAQVIQLFGSGGLFNTRGVTPLLIATTLFHLANAPVMPLVAQKIRHVGGTNGQVAAVVLVAQLVMIPVAFFAGRLGSWFGHKRILAVGFLVLPVRIALYTLTNKASYLVLLQALDGIGAGIFGVTAVLLCMDITHGRGRFNSLIGALATATGVGGVVGPLISGFFVQYFGFSAAFQVFAGIAVIAAVVLVCWMPLDNRHTSLTNDSVDATCGVEAR